jgi:hypothetical protein
MYEGFVKIHRKITEWEWYTDNSTRSLFLHLLFTVNWKDGNYRGNKVKRGSRITGRIQLSSETGMTEQSIRTAIKNLESTRELTRRKTSRGTVFTVVNYDKYQQANHLTNHQTNQDLTRDQPEPNQSLTTIEEGKEYKEIKEVKNNSELAESGPSLNLSVIPELDTFLTYGLQQAESIGRDRETMVYPIRCKYESWIENGWTIQIDGKPDRPIKNWKSTLRNTVPHLEPVSPKIEKPKIQNPLRNAFI